MLCLDADICIRVVAGDEHLTSLGIEIRETIIYFGGRRQIFPAESQIESEPVRYSPIIGRIYANFQKTCASPGQLKSLGDAAGYAEQEVRHRIARIAGGVRIVVKRAVKTIRAVA